MNEAALILALLLRVPFGPVECAYAMAGLDGVAVITCESQWKANAFRYEPGGGTSWGRWQIYDRYHEQYRDDELLHLAAGAAIWRDCKERAFGNFTIAVRLYNSGSRIRGIAWADRVRACRDDLAMYLWRRMR